MIDAQLGTGMKQRLAERQVWVVEPTRQVAVQVMRYIPDFDPPRPMVSRSTRRNPHFLYVVYENGRQSDWGVMATGQEVKIAGRRQCGLYRGGSVFRLSDCFRIREFQLFLRASFCWYLAFFVGLYGKTKYFSCQVDAKGNLAVGGLGKAEEEVFCRRIREGKETAKEAV